MEWGLDGIPGGHAFKASSLTLLTVASGSNAMVLLPPETSKK